MKSMKAIMFSVLLLSLSSFTSILIARSDTTLVQNSLNSCKAELIDLVGIGLKDKTQGIIPIPDAAWATFQVGGALAKTLPFPTAVTFGAERLTTIKAKDQWNYGYLFETKQTNVPGPFPVKVEEVGANKTARAAVAYFPKATSTFYESAFNTTYQFVWGGTSGTWIIPQKTPLIVTLPNPLAKVTNLTLKVAYMDNDNDSRPLTIITEAGDVRSEATALQSNAGDLLNIELLTLQNVPVGTKEVKVTLISPPSSADPSKNVWPTSGSKTQNGDSGMLLGATVSYPCTLPATATPTSTPTATATPTPSLSGKIAYMHGTLDSRWSTFVMNADGSGQTLLTDNKWNTSPAWSHDGKKIAFASFRDGNYEIYVMNADGSNQTRVTYSGGDDWDPTW